ncbi:hypothetical protein SAMN05216436_11799 [bacterium A37T11]|nr:hypothetical protein SAMN05216436_11799 [bacterium A37T11]
MDYDAVIIGAGACGLMCAVQAGFRGKRVLIIERNDRPGAKILISGGGRCNYTNIHTSPANFISADPDFSKSIFAQWSANDTIQFFANKGIFGHEKTLGQLFPVSNSARDIVEVFTALLQQQRQQIWLNSEVISIQKLINTGFFEIKIKQQDAIEKIIQARVVVVACGGLPVAKLGASDFGIRIARQFHLDITQTAPALVPLTITGKESAWFAALSGNSINARVYNDQISFLENILFTHWGLSGPAILQISSYWRPGQLIYIDLLPGDSIENHINAERKEGGRRLLRQLLLTFYSKKFVDALSKFLPVEKKIASLSKAEAKSAHDILHRFQVKPAGDKGYDKAEVMRGGVATHELDPISLESRKVPGLYFGGECVDVTGWLGGFNFQWAWASGFAISQAI